jgi:hypothetical protein
MIALGFCMNKHAYWRDGWNILDGIVVMVSVTDLAAAGTSIGPLKTMRVIRALRPLRMISRNQNLRLVVNTVFHSVPELLNLCIVGALFFLIFGLFALEKFKGRSMRCAGTFEASVPDLQDYFEPVDWPLDTTGIILCLDTTGQRLLRGTACGDVANYTSAAWSLDYRGTACTGPCVCADIDYNIWDCRHCPTIEGYECSVYTDDAKTCVEWGWRWIEMNQNFNNVWNSMLTLFEISTTEGWVDVMYAATDATEPMNQPIRDIQEGWSLFFVAFILVGAFFILNLCVGVIIDNFNEEKESGREVLITESQRKWVDYQRHFLSLRIFFPITHLNRLPPMRRRVVDFVLDRKFETAIMVCICLNTVTMGMKVYPEPEAHYNESLSGT